MDRPFIFKVLLNFILVLAMPPLVRAGVSTKNQTIVVVSYPPQDEKTDKNQKKPDIKKIPDDKQGPKQPDIRKVPKARKQSRPPVVIKPKIKIKPKIVRPNIKRP